MAKVTQPDGEAFTVLTDGSFADTLAQKLRPVADQMRDLLTQAGLRPYIVRLIWTQWSEGERGFGVEEVFQEEMLLPTPKVMNVETLDEMVRPMGTEEFGRVEVTQISGRYTENFLRGFDQTGAPVPENQNFYYEIEFPNENGTFPGIKRRFSIASAPQYYPGKFGWAIKLDKAIQNRNLNGTPASPDDYEDP